MPLFILSVIVQVAIVVHIVKTGRNTTWVWIVVMLPVAGAIAYFVVEVLPELTSSRRGRQAGRNISNALNPNRDYNDAARQLQVSDTVQNSLRLAQESLEKGMFQDAKTLYEKCLTGPHKDDPHIMFGLAQAEFGLNNLNSVKQLLDELITLNPDYKNQSAHLLYARTLEGLAQVEDAEHEYQTLHDYFSGPEASYFYAQFLAGQGRKEQAQQVLNEILQKADLAGKAYASLHKTLLNQTKQALREL